MDCDQNGKLQSIQNPANKLGTLGETMGGGSCKAGGLKEIVL